MNKDNQPNENGASANMIWQETIRGMEGSLELTSKLFEIAEPNAIYSEPVEAGDHTVIMASEVYTAMGLGFGSGGAVGADAGDDAAKESDDEAQDNMTGMGGGGGGGGFSMRRPVAAIVIGPGGVTVQPIFDLTKVGLALITAVGSMAFMMKQMRKGAL